MEPFYRAQLVDTPEQAIEKLVKAGVPRKIATAKFGAKQRPHE